MHNRDVRSTRVPCESRTVVVDRHNHRSVCRLVTDQKHLGRGIDSIIESAPAAFGLVHGARLGDFGRKEWPVYPCQLSPPPHPVVGARHCRRVARVSARVSALKAQGRSAHDQTKLSSNSNTRVQKCGGVWIRVCVNVLRGLTVPNCPYFTRCCIVSAVPRVFHAWVQRNSSAHVEGERNCKGVWR